MMATEEMKRCIKCRKLKLLCSDFHKRMDIKNGFCNICKECMKEQKKEYDKKEYSYSSEYYKKNKDKIKEYRKEYYKENKDKIKEYYEKNKDKRKEYNKKYYEKNKEQKKEYRKENKEHDNEYRKERRKKDLNFKLSCLLRSRIAQGVNSLKGPRKKPRPKDCGNVVKRAIYYLSSIEPEDYSGEKYHIDHIIPICAWDLTKKFEYFCATHPKNLQWLTAKENLSKNGKYCISDKKKLEKELIAEFKKIHI